MKKRCILGRPKCAQERFWSDCANAQANLSLRWVLMSDGTFSDVSTQWYECYYYSRTSIARTPMARLPWLIRTRFESLRNCSASSRKQKKKGKVPFFIMKLYVECSLESPHRGDSNENTLYTIIIWKIEKIFLYYRHLLPDLALWLTLSGLNYPLRKQTYSNILKNFTTKN